MKQIKQLMALLGALMLVFAFIGCGDSSSGDPTSPPVGGAKTATVSAQSGTFTAGTTSAVNLPVTTTNIVNGTYNISVANLPTGVSLPFPNTITISGGTGTLPLRGSSSTVAGTYTNLTLTIDGTITSAAFTLVISP